MLCCVAHSYLDIKVVCLPIVRQLPALHYVVCLFIAFRTIHYTLGYQVITDTWAVQQSLLLKKCGVETLAWCLANGVPCGWSSFWLGLHLSSSFSFCLSPSCGTCVGGRSPVCCGKVMAGRQEGHSSPGNWWQQPCCPFWGWPWKSLHDCYCLYHCWACHPRLWQTSGR